MSKRAFYTMAQYTGRPPSKLTHARLNAGLTCEELKRRAECSSDNIRLFRAASPAVKARIAAALGVSVEELEE